MTDRELLESAALATGKYYGEWSESVGALRIRHAGRWQEWNPLKNPADAMELAVQLGISLLMYPACIGTKFPQIGLPVRLIGVDAPYEDISAGQNKGDAARRAIVRAAAAIARATED